ncbi:AbiH family protein [Clostridium culturomicium]|uniref:AbiH family protein n=1 Tax=Clostridium culturomicium TaxID=1499683 RepID=UPI0038573241
MSVTFLIGNGFDISIGLKTRYSDFYDYIKNYFKSNENEILMSIENDNDLWSNLEMGLGKYTRYIGNNEDKLEKFYENKFDLDIKLRDYLRKEEDRIDWKHNATIKNVEDNFKRYIYNFYELFKPSEKDEIIRAIGNNIASNYKIISFNYTNVIKRCVELLPNKTELLYLHGSLEKDNSILGVNDSTQISNKYFSETSDMLVSMCKLDINKEIGEYSTTLAENMLSNDIICICGMSIGETDKYWWDKVVDNLVRGKINMVIIFRYDTELDMRNLLKVKRKKEFIQDQLLNFYSGEIEDRSMLKNKIKVLFNSNMFKLDVAFKEDNTVNELIASTITN